MEKSYNNWLALGVSILIMGIMLMTYSLTTYKQTKTLADKIDFQEVDNNTQMSTSDKYFKYLSYADYLNDELKKNKDLLIKNSTCNYVDCKRMKHDKMWQREIFARFCPCSIIIKPVSKPKTINPNSKTSLMIFKKQINCIPKEMSAWKHS